MDRSGKTALLVMACAIAFSGGILAGYIKNRDERPKKETPENVPVNVVSEKTQYELPTQRETEKKDEILNYLVVLNGDELGAYEVYDSGKRVKIESAAIENGNLRKDDREMLEKGISVYERDEALMMIEDFIS